MTIGSHLEELRGLPVFEFPEPGSTVPLPEPESVAWRISGPTYRDGDEEDWPEVFDRFLAAVDTRRVRSLVVGGWEDAYETDSAPIVARLIAANNRLTALESVFLGDMTFEDCEISWIQQSDVTPLLAAYPGLRSFGVRGGSNLAFPPVRHAALEQLVVEAGGLGADVVRGIAGSELPALTDLELWLGTDEYGADSVPGDLAPLLAGTHVPALRRLALRNSVIQDEIAEAVSGAPVVARLEHLDLSMGTLSDFGAVALLGGQPLTHLASLDLSHHYLSEEMRERIVAELAPHGVRVLTDEPQQEEDWGDGDMHRYVSVGE
ncbi:STM4015 family protein [Streptomyces sp. NPDC048604]|uniref:STM4015 family protein n=1 Tax=Streptomyces sp. NPDC048604 TaxID=3365578 RepID=UPI0037205574